ncbi:MAG: HD-GYP domain-containing protein [Solirubrobacterales bacterium]
MSALSDSEAKLRQLIATGSAYAQSRDTREVMGLFYAVMLSAGAVGAAVHATVAGIWDISVAALIAGSLVSAAYALAVPWGRIASTSQLSLYWLTVVAITVGVYVLKVPGLTILLLIPMMALSYTYGSDLRIVISHLLVASAAFALPAITGETEDPASALIITLPALLAVASLSGILADRFHTMRSTERGRYKATIEALSTALTARDGYTGSHSQETLWFVRAVCDELALSPNECQYVADVALLHDIGKIGIPNDVLHEPGRLSEDQWEVMKQHPVIGERIVAPIPGLEEVARAIRHEHEHWNGDGYPDGLRQGDIPLASRIVLVCDAFHAMTSDRPYRDAMSVGEARLELSRNAGVQFDPIVVGALLLVLDRRDPVFEAETAVDPAPQPRFSPQEA